MRGRKPKPPEIRQRRNKPKPSAASPGRPLDPSKPPDWLGAAARAEWDRVVRFLLAEEAASDWDRALLVAYCVSWERWSTAEQEVQRLGQLVKSPKTSVPMQNPFVSIANAAHERMVKLAGELRLTPVSRARAPIPKRDLQSINAASLRAVDETDEEREDMAGRVANVLDFRS